LSISISSIIPIIIYDEIPWEVSMESKPVSALTRAMAKVCVNCTVCRSARKNQKGFSYTFVKNIEGGLCPFCIAYEKVYGKKAHEPV
jgi:uncharacterized protein CbrC (UPF0167 family)